MFSFAYHKDGLQSDYALDLDLAIELAPYFRIKKEEGSIIIDQIKGVVSQWRKYANKYGFSRLEQENKTGAFKISD